MAIQRIRQLGDPVLRERSREVSLEAGAAGDVARILVDLRDTLHEFQRTHGFGRGISAVQIGIVQRIMYLEFEGAPLCIVNPVLTRKSAEKFTLWDDCFSFPDLLVNLERARSVEVRYRDERGQARTLAAEGALSELVQHELDHLDGILAVDRALDANSLATRDEWIRQRAAARALSGAS